jgi:hypothetical protein
MFLSLNYIQNNFTPIVWGGSIVAIILITQTLLIIFFEKIFCPKDMVKYNQIIFDTFSVIGTIYAVLYGLLTIFVLNNYQKVESTVTDEVSKIGNLYRNLYMIRDKKMVQPTIQIIYQYVDNIITNEMPVQKLGLSKDNAYQFKGWRLLQKVSQDLVGLQLDEYIKDKILDNLNDLYRARRSRLNSAELELPSVIWEITVLSILFMLINVSIIGCTNKYIKYISAYLLCISVSLMVILVMTIDRPFIGRGAITDIYYRKLEITMIRTLGLEYIFGEHASKDILPALIKSTQLENE